MVTAPSAAVPILRAARDQLRDAVRQELKALGHPDPIQPADVSDCIEKLIVSPDAVLILDWELGSEEVNQILGAIKGHFSVETRPVFLLIPEVSPQVIATGTEYGVSQMHAGPISRLAIRECLTALFSEDDATRAVRETLVLVAQARERDEWSVAGGILTQALEQITEPQGRNRLAMELAENLIHENEWARAMPLLEPLVSAQPPNVRALHLMGRCMMAKGDFDAALGMLEKAKLINPHNVDRLIDIGNACIRTDQLEEARANFEQATRLAPTEEQAKVAQMGTGQCMLMSGEVNEALALMKSISGPREMASIFNTAAVLSIRSGAYDKGMSLYKSALAALGKDKHLAARLMFNMGLGYKRWSKPEQALGCFNRSLELDPSYTKAQRQIERAEPGKADKSGKPAKAPAAGGKPPSHFAEEEFTAVGSDRPAPAADDDEGDPLV